LHHKTIATSYNVK